MCLYYDYSDTGILLTWSLYQEQRLGNERGIRKFKQIGRNENKRKEMEGKKGWGKNNRLGEK